MRKARRITDATACVAPSGCPDSFDTHFRERMKLLAQCLNLRRRQDTVVESDLSQRALEVFHGFRAFREGFLPPNAVKGRCLRSFHARRGRGIQLAVDIDLQSAKSRIPCQRDMMPAAVIYWLRTFCQVG